jgi:outer membrane protein TolC
MQYREGSMLKCQRVSAAVRLAGVAAVLTIYADAQDLPSMPLLVPGVPAIRPGTFAGQGPFTIAVSRSGTEGVPISAPSPLAAQPSRGPQHVTLEQVQQSANRAALPLQRLAMLSVEAARQHRLGVQADYFPKFGATFWNLHTTDFLGQIVAVRRPLLGVAQQVPIQIVNQHQTAAFLTMAQPITPILQVHQAVKIARADERIAMSKAGAAATRNARNAEVEEAYFQLLIAQRQLASAEWKLRNGESRPLYAGASIGRARASGSQVDSAEARKGVESATARVKERTASLNRIMGWPEETELELEIPDPLVENISLQDVSDKPVAAIPELVEAEQTVVKARAAEKLSKLAYVPTVAAVSGYAFQNVLPAVLSNFGYGGVMASYTLFDFGKREHAIKEAHAQFEMAEIGLQAAKAKSAADLKKSYYELERSRQLSNVAQRMGSSAALVINASATSESLEVKAARAEMELEILQADLGHREAFARLKALMGEPR